MNMSKTNETIKKPAKGEDLEKIVSSIVRAIIRRTSPMLREAADAVAKGESSDGAHSKVSAEVKRLLGLVKEIPTERSELPEEIRTSSGPITEEDFKRAKALKDAGASYSQIGCELATDPVALNTRFLHGSAPKPRAPKAEKPAKAEPKTEGKGKSDEAPAKGKRSRSKSGRAKKATEGTAKKDDKSGAQVGAPPAAGKVEW
jgi:hypothetical protein